ncbi:MAG: ester cyclase [Chloroflexota bacterium]|nr:ester cyclase [Chloroflexota bacterium]
MNGIMRPFRWLGSRSLVRSLRFRLVLVVLLASLPSFALLFLTAAQQREDAVAAGQDESRRLASLIAANQSNVATQIGTVLLATVDLLDQTPEGCRQVLRRLIVPTTTPLEGRSGPDLGVDGATFVQVVVLDDALGEFCVGSAGGGLLGEVERELAANALDAGRLVTGNRQTSAAGSMVLTYAMPVETEDAGGNQVNRVIVATVEVYALTQFALEANLPRDSFIFVVDSDGVLEQRYPGRGNVTVGQSLAGTPVVDAARDIPLPEDAPERPDEEIDGQKFVFGSDDFWTPGPEGRLTLSYVLVGFPESVVVQRADEKFNENLGKLGIAAMVALVAAWVGADLFIGRDAETRKAQVRDFYHAFSTGSINELDEIIGPGFVDRMPVPGQANGIDGLRQNIAAFRTAFPQGQVIIRELIAEHDKVVARVTLSGTHVADYFDVSPSGKHVVADGVETFRFQQGMIVESWSMFGELRQRDQALETPGPAPAAAPGFMSRLFRRKQRATRAES